jgi:hypothetical protein
MKQSEAMSKYSLEDERRSSISGKLGRSGIVELSESKSVGRGIGIEVNT